MGAARPLSGRALGAAVRVGVTARGIADNLAGGWRLTADGASFARWAGDTVRYRQLRLWDAGRGARRAIRVHPDAELTYRLDRGDIRTVAEVWISRAYELPPTVPLRRIRTIVDLGANIGLTGVWLARRYGCERLIAVEPSPENAELTRLNLEQNGVPTTVLQAAVGGTSGIASFALDRESTLGRLGDGALRVPVVTMDEVLGRLTPEARVDLLKMDIEGGEMDIIDGEADWLNRVDVIIAELHPKYGDTEAVVRRLEARGFHTQRVASGSAHGPKGDDFMSCFYRAEAGA